ncbi:hypothetical protein DTO212C5_8902 [Paecilomyces variotii]|nr:hypothetical protein DTO212C5_8902 [Paecilomyces variotii]
MARRMLKELKPIDPSRDLQPGESFIVYYKNTGIGRKDLWLGIICLETMVPAMLRRFANARPKVGEWVYLPGKNNYQWLEKTNLYHVEARPPSSLSSPLRPDSKLFLTLHKIAKSGKDAEFWFEMAAEERKAKGILDRKPSLVLPTKKPAEKDPMTPKSDSHGSSKTTDQHAQTKEAGGFLAQKRPRVDQGYVDTGTKSPSTGTTPKTPDRATPDDIEPERPPVSVDVSPNSESGSRNPTPKGKHMYRSVGTQTDPESLQRHSPDDVFDIYVGSGADHGIFQLSFKSIEKCPLLIAYLKDKDVPYIFHPGLYGLPASEFEPIYSFLVTGEFDPKLVDRSKSVNSEERPRILGDQFRFGHKYSLADIDSSEELDKQILRFGRIYMNAGVFGLDILQGLALWKIQIAWNSFAGLHHLVPILEVAQMTVGKANDDPERGADFSRDPLYNWMIGFFADTMDLFLHSCPHHFWQVMGPNHELQASVMRRRAEKLAKDPSRYPNLEEIIASRDSSRFPHQSDQMGG